MTIFWTFTICIWEYIVEYNMIQKLIFCDNATHVENNMGNHFHSPTDNEWKSTLVKFIETITKLKIVISKSHNSIMGTSH